MRILLIGDYSRLHYTLAEGLRALGHEAIVASDGDGWKNYPRDIDLTRKSSSIIDTARSLTSVLNKFSKFKGYDVVQIMNPCFTTQTVRVNEYLFNRLKKNNKKVFLGAFGDDSYWVRACLSDKILKYSEFFVNHKSTELKFNKKLVAKWINSRREVANKKMAREANGIIACLYEYYRSYEPEFADKLTYIPLPVNTDVLIFSPIEEIPEKINFFIGIDKDRTEYKGTDIMDKALTRIAQNYPDQVIVSSAESVNYDKYKQLMQPAHVVLDQLYSHTPAMNALLAMAQGKVLVGGGEPEIYDLMGEYDLRPVVNVFPSEEDVYNKLEDLILHKEKLLTLSRLGKAFVEKNHNYKIVAQQYIEYWERM